jgi:hypothetical protein
MTVRGFVTANGRTLEHGQFGGFSLAADVGLAQALVEGVLRYGTRARVALPFDLGVPYTSIGTTGGDALHVGDLFDVRLDELRTIHEATLPVALER